MRKVANLLLIVCLVVVFTACESRTDRTDSGGVLLSITDFDGLPIAVGVNSSGGFVTVEEINVANVAANPNGAVSDLMNVEIVSYEVLYSRADGGTRTPSKFVRGLFGVVPVGGEFTVEGDVSESQQAGLERIREFVTAYDGTGVQTALETALFDVLGAFAVFPGSANGRADSEGVFRDCFILPEGATTADFAAVAAAVLEA